jgi:hypothetical protein
VSAGEAILRLVTPLPNKKYDAPFFPTQRQNGDQHGGSRISAAPSEPEIKRPSKAHHLDAPTRKAMPQVAKAATSLAYTKLPNRKLDVDLHGRPRAAPRAMAANGTSDSAIPRRLQLIREPVGSLTSVALRRHRLGLEVASGSKVQCVVLFLQPRILPLFDQNDQTQTSPRLDPRVGLVGVPARGKLASERFHKKALAIHVELRLVIMRVSPLHAALQLRRRSVRTFSCKRGVP